METRADRGGQPRRRQVDLRLSLGAKVGFVLTQALQQSRYFLGRQVYPVHCLPLFMSPGLSR
jgi:hypothetical protein